MGSTEQSTQPAYSAPPETVTFDGLLFDMDGTIIDSTAAVVKHWERCVPVTIPCKTDMHG